MVNLGRLDPAKANLDHERSRLRWVNLADPEELTRLWEIEKDPEVVKLVGNIAEDHEDMVAFTTNDRNYMVLAVVGKDGHVEPAEVNKLQGWISIYNEEKRRLLRFANDGIADLLGTGKRILEIGFAKHPKAKTGQMASALRQTLAFLQSEHKKDGKHDLIITAYAALENQASVRVLEAAGFKKLGTVKYHVRNKTLDHFFVWQGV